MKKEKVLLIMAVLFVVCVWGLNWWLLKDSDNRGTFGDMFGGVNALFSGLAFIGVAYAVALQKKEFEQTNIEFMRNAEAQRASAQLQALTVLFEEYKRLVELKDQEIMRVITQPLSAGTPLHSSLKKERDVLLERKNKILSELERISGL